MKKWVLSVTTKGTQTREARSPIGTIPPHRSSPRWDPSALALRLLSLAFQGFRLVGGGVCVGRR